MKPVSPPWLPIAPFRKVPEGNFETGFTLLESLIAIVVIAVTVVSITPPIFWATGTRVQNRRAEQAAQLAQAEVDRVRAVVERRGVALALADLPPRVGTTVSPNAGQPTTAIDPLVKLRSVVPGCERGDDNPPASPTQVILVDTDPGADNPASPCKPEYMIQVFRGTGLPQATGGAAETAPNAFVMGVRVYSIVARPNLGNLPAPRDTRLRLRATAGLGTQQTQPLAVLYTPIVRSNRSDTLDLYRALCVEARKEGSDAGFCAERK
jgi:prepilin-type N-terminal cleavage/methylation domain-containing protein